MLAKCAPVETAPGDSAFPLWQYTLLRLYATLCVFHLHLFIIICVHVVEIRDNLQDLVLSSYHVDSRYHKLKLSGLVTSAFVYL